MFLHYRDHEASGALQEHFRYNFLKWDNLWTIDPCLLGQGYGLDEISTFLPGQFMFLDWFSAIRFPLSQKTKIIFLSLLHKLSCSWKYLGNWHFLRRKISKSLFSDSVLRLSPWNVTVGNTEEGAGWVCRAAGLSCSHAPTARISQHDD